MLSNIKERFNHKQDPCFKCDIICKYPAIETHFRSYLVMGLYDVCFQKFVGFPSILQYCFLK